MSAAIFFAEDLSLLKKRFSKPIADTPRESISAVARKVSAEPFLSALLNRDGCDPSSSLITSCDFVWLSERKRANAAPCAPAERNRLFETAAIPGYATTAIETKVNEAI
jgi:hypothetical protein